MRAASERRYGGVSASERAAERRRRLVAAGVELIGSAGFDATSVAAVCSEAGVGKRYFYEHFSNRTELLLAVFDEVTGEVLSAVGAATAAAPADLRLRARAGIDAFLEALTEDPRRARIQLVEVVARTPQVEERRRAVLYAFVDFVAAVGKQLAPDAGLDPVDRRLRAMSLVAATNELTADWLLGRLDVPRDRLLDHLVRLYEAEARAPATAAPLQPEREIDGSR